MTQNLIRRDRGPTASWWDYLGQRGFLFSDLTTLGVVCYVADKSWPAIQFSLATWVMVLLAWLLPSIGTTIWAGAAEGRPASERYQWVALLLGALLCAMVVKLFATPFSWRQAGAFGCLFLAALGINRVFRGLMARAGVIDRWEGLRFGVAQGVALFAVHPYARSALLGAGDAMSYSLAIADFLKQARAGIFPVFIGQSEFAYNGGFHPLRNAPYLLHLAGGFDLLSLGTLNVFALQNLTVLGSMLAAIVGCYAALSISLSRGSWLALGLAILYGLCPGVLAPLYGGDMYPTFMTLPFLPWLALGVERSAGAPARAWPWLLQGAALAAIWLAHPPVGAWAMLLTGIAALWILLRERSWTVFIRMAAAPIIFLALSGYLFVSVSTLRLPAVTRAEALETIDYKITTLRSAWAGSLLPVSPEGNHLLADIQLGYGLWASLLLAVVGVRKTKPGRLLLAGFALLLLFAWPIPILTRWAWHSLPTDLLRVTNQWPVERFYVLLAVLSVFVIGPVFNRWSSRGAAQKNLLALLLLAAGLWSAVETGKFFRRAATITLTESASGNLHRAENITLSRTHSYEYLGTPAYFSNGHMDPRLETRLLDAETRLAFADGSTPRSESAGEAAGSTTLTLQKRPASGVLGSLHLGPRQASLLRFDFLGHQPEGELQIMGGGLHDSYALPQSGYPKAFGSGPEAGHALILENTTGTAEEISFRFTGRDAPNDGDIFARVWVEPLAESERAVRLKSLTPFHASVTASRECYLETPKLFVPGYRALVDGVVAPITRSQNGLVAIPLSRGEHDILLSYPGSRRLRWSYYASAASWIALLSLVSTFALSRGSCETWIDRLLRFNAGLPRRPGKGTIYLGMFFGAVVLAVMLGFGFRSKPALSAGSGAIQMSIKLPWPVFGRAEPLVTTGHEGAGDFIYLVYVDGRHVIVGHDKWKFGGRKSAPIPVDYDQPQNVEIRLSSLDADMQKMEQNPNAPAGLEPAEPRLFVKWNGMLVLSEEVLAHPAKPGEVTFGENTIGGSTTVRDFSGDILGIRRIDSVRPK